MKKCFAVVRKMFVMMVLVCAFVGAPMAHFEAKGGYDDCAVVIRPFDDELGLKDGS